VVGFEAGAVVVAVVVAAVAAVCFVVVAVVVVVDVVVVVIVVVDVDAVPHFCGQKSKLYVSRGLQTLQSAQVKVLEQNW